MINSQAIILCTFIYLYSDSTPHIQMARIASHLFNILLPSRFDFQPFREEDKLPDFQNGRKLSLVTLSGLRK